MGNTPVKMFPPNLRKVSRKLRTEDQKVLGFIQVLNPFKEVCVRLTDSGAVDAFGGKQACKIGDIVVARTVTPVDGSPVADTKTLKVMVQGAEPFAGRRPLKSNVLLADDCAPIRVDAAEVFKRSVKSSKRVEKGSLIMAVYPGCSALYRAVLGASVEEGAKCTAPCAVRFFGGAGGLEGKTETVPRCHFFVVGDGDGGGEAAPADSQQGGGGEAAAAAAAAVTVAAEQAAQKEQAGKAQQARAEQEQEQAAREEQQKRKRAEVTRLQQQEAQQAVSVQETKVQGVEQVVAQITAAATAAGSLLPAKAAVAAAEAKVTGAQGAVSATEEFTKAASEALSCQLGRLTVASEGLDTALEQQRELGGPVKRSALPAAGSGAAQSALSTMELLCLQARENLKVAMQQLQQAQQELKAREAEHPCAGGDLLALMAQITLTSAEGRTVEGGEEATAAGGAAAQAKPAEPNHL
jgi:hypothetical protein